MIPETKVDAVAHALKAAFGVRDFEEIRPLTAGLSSALIFRIIVKGKPYLLRIIMRTDAMADPAHYYACMKTAATAGIAPAIWYAGVEDRISITDFIEAVPFPLDIARNKLPQLLKRLHVLPAFPFRMNYLDFVDSSVRKAEEANILPAVMTREAFRQYERIRLLYPRNKEEYVAGHNDLKPDNILYDGERVWLVDWEAAFLNDRYMDLAVVANFLLVNDKDEQDLLERYFEEDPGPYEQARFFIMRQIMHMAYFSFFLRLSYPPGTAFDPGRPIPEYREFHLRLWEGRVNLLDKKAQGNYALVHLERVTKNMQLHQFEEALEVLALKA